MKLLLQYDWPGNVRELENCLERAAVLAEGEVIDLTQLRQVLHPGLSGGAEPQPESRQRLRDMERTLILDTLRQTRGNKTAAAALLGISLRGLHYKLKRFENDRARSGTG
jgi:DNA-binding NtrC family response regulator